MKVDEIKPVLSIAGLDPSAGAGILADMRVFSAMGLYGTGVITTLTAQNSGRVAELFPVEGKVVAAQLEELIADIVPAATKTGMLVTVDTIQAIAPRAADGSLGQLVVDPVFSSTSGSDFTSSGLVDAISSELLPHARLVTPNLDEAELLTGVEIGSPDEAADAAVKLAETGVGAVIITGGHLPGEPVDILLEDGKLEYLRGNRLRDGENIHGSGCFFSAACTAYLALGSTIPQAAAGARKLSQEAIGSSFRPGKGMAVPWKELPFEPLLENS